MGVRRGHTVSWNGHVMLVQPKAKGVRVSCTHAGMPTTLRCTDLGLVYPLLVESANVVCITEQQLSRGLLGLIPSGHGAARVRDIRMWSLSPHQIQSSIRTLIVRTHLIYRSYEPYRKDLHDGRVSGVATDHWADRASREVRTLSALTVFSTRCRHNVGQRYSRSGQTPNASGWSRTRRNNSWNSIRRIPVPEGDWPVRLGSPGMLVTPVSNPA